MSVKAMKQALEALENSKPSDAGGVLDAEAMNGLWHAHYAAKNALRTALSQQPATGEPVALNIIRYWPDGFADELERVWRDLVGFIPNYKLYDLQSLLAKHGFVMQVYEANASKATHPAPSVPADVVRDAERYRWLRNLDHWPAPFSSSQEPEPIRGSDLDAAIDAAMLAAK